jgi:hypothetical protein
MNTSEQTNTTHVGTWHWGATDVEGFMVLGATAGALCVSDGKSQASFDLVLAEGALTMGDYAYGGGDTLEVSADGSTLERRSEEKGVVYTSTYARWEAALPGWCSEQLDAL